MSTSIPRRSARPHRGVPSSVWLSDVFVTIGEILARADWKFDDLRESIDILLDHDMINYSEPLMGTVLQMICNEARGMSDGSQIRLAVKYVVEHGAHVNVTDDDGFTPLMQTAVCGEIQLSRYLLQNGANRDARGKLTSRRWKKKYNIETSDAHTAAEWAALVHEPEVALEISNFQIPQPSPQPMDESNDNDNKTPNSTSAHLSELDFESYTDEDVLDVDGNVDGNRDREHKDKDGPGYLFVMSDDDTVLPNLITEQNSPFGGHVIRSSGTFRYRVGGSVNPVCRTVGARTYNPELRLLYQISVTQWIAAGKACRQELRRQGLEIGYIHTHAWFRGPYTNIQAVMIQIAAQFQN